MPFIRIRKSLSLAAAALVASGALAAGPLPTSGADCDQSLSACRGIVSAESSAAANRTRLAAIQTQVADAHARMTALAGLVADLGRQIDAQELAIAQVTAAIAAIDAQIRGTEADIGHAEAHIEVRNSLLAQRVRAMDKRGSVDYVQFFVTSRSFVELIDRVSLMTQVLSSDHHLVNQLRHDRDQLRTLRGQLGSQRATQTGLLQERERRRDELAQNREVQRGAFAEQARLEAQFQAERLELERQQAQIQDQIVSLQAQYQAQLAALVPPAPLPPAPTPVPSPGPTGAPGPTPTPVARPSSGFLWPEDSHLITQGFGCTPYTFEPYNPSCASKHWHTGVDIAGPDGAPVYASAAGILQAYPGSSGGYGNYIILLHAGGYTTLYGHLASIAVASGRTVQQGQVIGYEGSTGNSTGPHLHFEIRQNGNYLNPCSYTSC